MPTETGAWGSELRGLDAQDVQCCGVLRWHSRSWCSNWTVTRKMAYSAKASAAKRLDRRTPYLPIRSDDTPMTLPGQTAVRQTTSCSLTRESEARPYTSRGSCSTRTLGHC